MGFTSNFGFRVNDLSAKTTAPKISPKNVSCKHKIFKQQKQFRKSVTIFKQQKQFLQNFYSPKIELEKIVMDRNLYHMVISVIDLLQTV
jgi:hypothetical protein